MSDLKKRIEALEQRRSAGGAQPAHVEVILGLEGRRTDAQQVAYDNAVAAGMQIVTIVECDMRRPATPIA
jgi:hypothetical protein